MMNLAFILSQAKPSLKFYTQTLIHLKNNNNNKENLINGKIILHLKVIELYLSEFIRL